ncbi:MAG: hypoxanthine phosphoribosyltransferase [Clostridia bacterium]|nr:hypoxanthine phosphoribosyltransferase [Clostridia bacterium]
MEKHVDCERILFDTQLLAERIKEVAECINKDYEGKEPLVVCTLKGALIFCSDLIRSLTCPISLDFMKVSSYGNSAVSGELHIRQGLSTNVTDRDVIIVEDIMDSGKTIYFLKSFLLREGAKSVKTVVLLDKPERRRFPLEPDYKCFEIEDEFVIGYGLDYAERYRNLPYVGILKRSIYEKE